MINFKIFFKGEYTNPIRESKQEKGRIIKTNNKYELEYKHNHINTNTHFQKKKKEKKQIP